MAAHVLSQVAGADLDEIPVRRALLSVSDKTDLVAFAQKLAQHGVELLSTGGTAKKLREAGLEVTDVAEYTQAPEMMDGRVKTLHPMVHGGILYVRGNAQHEADLEANGVKPIDMVVLNLYPFEQTVAGGAAFDQCIENIDIGGPSMLRSASKNHRYVVIASSPSQYDSIAAEMDRTSGSTPLALRRKLAAHAFALSASYDSAIAQWITSTPEVDAGSAGVVTRSYTHQRDLKYGCNPHQKPAAIYTTVGGKMPFQVRNGAPGYINLLDAVNAYQLVRELRESLGLAAASSFKHVSPAGAGVAVPLTPMEMEAYEVTDASELTPASLAYLRARNADPMSSFGDFAAMSDVVDLATARILKREVSDGIIAPGFDPEALELLATKKGGKYIILEADPDFVAPATEFRELHGITFSQKRNATLITPAMMSNVVTADADAAVELPAEAVRDLVLASITLKYTQSNSVGYAFSGQMIGVGAGQQSRVDCVKLAGRKVAVWQLRQHPKVRALQFKGSVKRSDRVNARVRYIEGDMTANERPLWEANFETLPEPLTEEEKNEFMASLQGVALSSDAFFPFRDSLDHASKLGVSFVAQPGGSVMDAGVTEAAKEYGMQMVHHGVRLFHH